MTVRPRAMLGSLSWFGAFGRNATAERITKISESLSRLTTRARTDLDNLLTAHRLTDLIRNAPVFELYDTDDEFNRARHYLNARRSLGFVCEVISGAEAAAREPAIAKDFAKAVMLADWRSVVDGARFVEALSAVFMKSGGRIRRGEVRRITRADKGASGVELSDRTHLPADFVVVAAGAWTKALLGPLGATPPIEAATGYSTVIRNPGVDMHHAVVYARGGFGITPYESGLAVAGGIEFAGIDGKPNWNRARLLVEKAGRVVPGLTNGAGMERIGRRPLTPDTLPIIGRMPGFKNVIVASGHGQLGLTLGATTGLLVSDLVAGASTNFDLTPYCIERFAG